MQLRNYQDQFVTHLSTMLASGKRKIVGQLATGGGKTIVFSAISNRYSQKNARQVLILVHRKELLHQTRKTLYRAYGISAEPIEAGKKYIPDAPVYVGMVESTFRRVGGLRNIGLVIIDEAHIDTFNKVHKLFPDQMIIGFTATPMSSSPKNPMKNHYEDIVCGIDIHDLIEQGSLCQCITYAPRDIVDRAALEVKGNEFDESKMAGEFSKPKHIKNTVQAYQNHAAGTKAIVFNVNVDHSLKVCAAFQEAGLQAFHIDGTTPAGDRANILKWFADTPNGILCNVGIATTGFDEPTIETVIVNKSTKSLPLWLQMCGRGGRPTESKSMFRVIDMGGNATKLGEWHNQRNWYDLFHNPPKKRDSESVAPTKDCPECEAIIAVAARRCKYCDCELPAPPPPPEEDLYSEMIILTKGIDVAALMEQNAQKKEYATFFDLADKIALQAKGHVKVMTDKVAQMLLAEYHIKAKEWCNGIGKRYNQWHKDRAQETLYKKLQERYPSWTPEEVTA